jgi:prepilin-type N-terminal cleavage/methylation domain-containing protein
MHVNHGLHSVTMSKGESGQAGFTLLELLMVLFITTLILGLSVVFFIPRLASGRLDATAREMAATMRHARSLSQITGESQMLTIDLDSRHYGIEGRAMRSIPPDVHIKVIDPFSGEMQAGKYQFICEPRGLIGAGTIVLWNAKRSITLMTDPVIGAVLIK